LDDFAADPVQPAYGSIDACHTPFPDACGRQSLTRGAARKFHRACAVNFCAGCIDVQSFLWVQGSAEYDE
jgi:hypothetical protein